MNSDLSIITATLCVALILSLSGCASVPAAGVKHAIKDRLKTQEAPETKGFVACPNPVNITIISNEICDFTKNRRFCNGVPNE